MLQLLFLTPQKILFDGECKSIIIPAEAGVLEVLSYHKDLLSRILPGIVVVNYSNSFSIRRGIIKVERNSVMIIAELAG